MKEYNVKIIIPKDLSIEEMKRRVEEFQSIFVTVAAKYYSQKRKNRIREAE